MNLETVSLTYQIKINVITTLRILCSSCLRYSTIESYDFWLILKFLTTQFYDPRASKLTFFLKEIKLELVCTVNACTSARLSLADVHASVWKF